MLDQEVEPELTCLVGHLNSPIPGAPPFGVTTPKLGAGSFKRLNPRQLITGKLRPSGGLNSPLIIDDVEEVARHGAHHVIRREYLVSLPRAPE
jgi:hypothetical protein